MNVIFSPSLSSRSRAPLKLKVFRRLDLWELVVLTNTVAPQVRFYLTLLLRHVHPLIHSSTSCSPHPYLQSGQRTTMPLLKLNINKVHLINQDSMRKLKICHLLRDQADTRRKARMVVAGTIQLAKKHVQTCVSIHPSKLAFATHFTIVQLDSSIHYKRHVHTQFPNPSATLAFSQWHPSLSRGISLWIYRQIHYVDQHCF